MVKHYGIISNGVVINAVLADDEYAASQGWILLPDGVGPNWRYDGAAFSEPLFVHPPKDVQSSARAEAYRSEADPLFFMSQRGEATIEEWQAKVAEIKARYPYPAE